MNALLIALGAGLCWGVGECFTKSVLHTGQIGPFTAMAVRTTIALPVLWLAAWLAMRATGAAGEPRAWLQADGATLAKLTLGSGLTAGALAMLFFYLALSLGDISRVKPVAFSTAIAVASVLGAVFFREAMPAHKIVAILLILAGVLLMAWK
ncbi:MAG: EamA family transporter [Planctomycetota bacterium]|nr:EamA family transporter [Planctomycetota bacterium]